MKEEHPVIGTITARRIRSDFSAIRVDFHAPEAYVGIARIVERLFGIRRPLFIAYRCQTSGTISDEARDGGRDRFQSSIIISRETRKDNGMPARADLADSRLPEFLGSRDIRHPGFRFLFQSTTDTERASTRSIRRGLCALDSPCDSPGGKKRAGRYRCALNLLH